jgi:hypothetical protein
VLHAEDGKERAWDETQGLKLNVSIGIELHRKCFISRQDWYCGTNCPEEMILGFIAKQGNRIVACHPRIGEFPISALGLLTNNHVCRTPGKKQNKASIFE